MIGSVVAGRYEINALLAEGPIFAAYAARDRQQQKDVTLRILKPPFDHEEAFVAGLRTAVEATSQVQSPQIEGLIEVASDKRPPFLVSELSRGYSLAERIRKLAPFSIPVSIATAISVLEGLVALHRQGLVHGDLSTVNVWVQPDGAVRVQLPAIWEAYKYSETAGAVVLPYMAAYLAPEVSAGGNPSASSDLYAVGVLLYQLLAGRLPYPAETPISMALKHATEPVPSVRMLNPSIPKVLDEIIKKALAKAPGDRYSTAEEMLSDLVALRDALRFGKTLTWPIRKGEPVRETRMVAPKMSAVRVEQREREEDWEEDSGDLPSWMRWSFLAGLAVLLIFVGSFVWSNLNRPRQVAVPNLKNMNIAEARTLLAQTGLKLRILARISNESVPADSIISVSPGPGTKVRENSEVGVRLSSGSRFVEVPDLKGRTLDEARSILGQLDLTLDEKTDQVASADVSKGLIVAALPSKGTKVERNSTVKAQISSGEPPPVVANTPPVDAQQPDAKTPETAPAKKYLFTLRLKFSDLTEDTQVKVEMKDEGGTRTLLDERKQPDQRATLTAESASQTATFMIYYNGQLIKAVTRNASDTP